MAYDQTDFSGPEIHLPFSAKTTVVLLDDTVPAGDPRRKPPKLVSGQEYAEGLCHLTGKPVFLREPHTEEEESMTEATTGGAAKAAAKPPGAKAQGQGAKKPAAAKPAAKKPAAAPKGGTKAPSLGARKHADDAKITVLKKENPHRENTGRADAFNDMLKCKSVGDYYKTDNKTKYLSDWAKSGHIKIEGGTKAS